MAACLAAQGRVQLAAALRLPKKKGRLQRLEPKKKDTTSIVSFFWSEQRYRFTAPAKGNQSDAQGSGFDLERRHSGVSAL